MSFLEGKKEHLNVEFQQNHQNLFRLSILSESNSYIFIFIETIPMYDIQESRFTSSLLLPNKKLEMSSFYHVTEMEGLKIVLKRIIAKRVINNLSCDFLEGYSTKSI